MRFTVAVALPFFARVSHTAFCVTHARTRLPCICLPYLSHFPYHVCLPSHARFFTTTPFALTRTRSARFASHWFFWFFTRLRVWFWFFTCLVMLRCYPPRALPVTPIRYPAAARAAIRGCRFTPVGYTPGSRIPTPRSVLIPMVTYPGSLPALLRTATTLQPHLYRRRVPRTRSPCRNVSGSAVLPLSGYARTRCRSVFVLHLYGCSYTLPPLPAYRPGYAFWVLVAPIHVLSLQFPHGCYARSPHGCRAFGSFLDCGLHCIPGSAGYVLPRLRVLHTTAYLCGFTHSCVPSYPFGSPHRTVTYLPGLRSCTRTFLTHSHLHTLPAVRLFLHTRASCVDSPLRFYSFTCVWLRSMRLRSHTLVAAVVRFVRLLPHRITCWLPRLPFARLPRLRGCLDCVLRYVYRVHVYCGWFVAYVPTAVLPVAFVAVGYCALPRSAVQFILVCAVTAHADYAHTHCRTVVHVAYVYLRFRITDPTVPYGYVLYARYCHTQHVTHRFAVYGSPHIAAPHHLYRAVLLRLRSRLPSYTTVVTYTTLLVRFLPHRSALHCPTRYACRTCSGYLIFVAHARYTRLRWVTRLRHRTRTRCRLYTTFVCYLYYGLHFH